MGSPSIILHGGVPLTTRLASSYPALDFLLLTNEATVKTLSNIYSLSFKSAVIPVAVRKKYHKTLTSTSNIRRIQLVRMSR